MGYILLCCLFTFILFLLDFDYCFYDINESRIRKFRKFVNLENFRKNAKKVND